MLKRQTVRPNFERLATLYESVSLNVLNNTFATVNSMQFTINKEKIGQDIRFWFLDQWGFFNIQLLKEWRT